MSMATYSVIADISDILIQILRRNLCPDIIANPQAVNCCSPGEREDSALGLHLYDIQTYEGLRVSAPVDVDEKTQRFPPALFILYYMITAYSDAELRYRITDEQRILGRTLQVFNDNPVIDCEEHRIDGDFVFGMNIEYINISVDEKSKIWSFPNINYKTSLFYKVYPIEIKSARSKEVSRVTSLDLNII